MDKANLTRIRDNQRRSRARRKEYVQELENRLKDFKRQGVEASSAIQKAARRVAEENKQLRALLRQKGFSDEETNGFLQTNNTSALHPLVQSPPPAIGSTAQALQLSLEHRSLQPFEPMAHPINFTSELAELDEKRDVVKSTLYSQRRLSTSPDRVRRKTHCWDSESPPNHNTFNINTPRYPNSFSSESSGYSSQLYTSTTGSHLLNDGTQSLLDATSTEYGPLLLDPVDRETKPVCAGPIAYSNIETFQLHHREDLLPDELPSIQSAAATIGCTIAANEVSSFIGLKQKGSDYTSYTTCPSYWTGDAVRALNIPIENLSQHQV